MWLNIKCRKDFLLTCLSFTPFFSNESFMVLLQNIHTSSGNNKQERKENLLVDTLFQSETYMYRERYEKEWTWLYIDVFQCILFLVCNIWQLFFLLVYCVIQVIFFSLCSLSALFLVIQNNDDYYIYLYLLTYEVWYHPPPWSCYLYRVVLFWNKYTYSNYYTNLFGTIIHGICSNSTSW